MLHHTIIRDPFRTSNRVHEQDRVSGFLAEITAVNMSLMPVIDRCPVLYLSNGVQQYFHNLIAEDSTYGIHDTVKEFPA